MAHRLGKHSRRTDCGYHLLKRLSPSLLGFFFFYKIALLNATVMLLRPAAQRAIVAAGRFSNVCRSHQEGISTYWRCTRLFSSFEGGGDHWEARADRFGDRSSSARASSGGSRGRGDGDGWYNRNPVEDNGLPRPSRGGAPFREQENTYGDRRSQSGGRGRVYGRGSERGPGSFNRRSGPTENRGNRPPSSYDSGDPYRSREYSGGRGERAGSGYRGSYGSSSGGYSSGGGGYVNSRMENKEPPAYGSYEGDHLYGIAPVRLALAAKRRAIKELLVQSGQGIVDPSWLSTSDDLREGVEDEGEDEEGQDETPSVNADQNSRTPPNVSTRAGMGVVQSSRLSAGNVKKKDKGSGPAAILQLAREQGIPIREFSKHDLNMLTDSRPHQGFVLRAAPLKMPRILELEKTDAFKCVLALDEVWDPQNFGALIRTSCFLRCDKIVVCAKNSAPLTPTVSKASAGSLEVMQENIFSTDNMMRFLDRSIANGWQVIGTDLGSNAVGLDDVSTTVPTVIVLGNEGHGIRTNILRRCTQLVKILPPQPTFGAASGMPAGAATDTAEALLLDLVDSLNVSVTGGIMLHHFLAGGSKSDPSV